MHCRPPRARNLYCKTQIPKGIAVVTSCVPRLLMTNLAGLVKAKLRARRLQFLADSELRLKSLDGRLKPKGYKLLNNSSDSISRGPHPLADSSPRMSPNLLDGPLDRLPRMEGDPRGPFFPRSASVPRDDLASRVDLIPRVAVVPRSDLKPRVPLPPRVALGSETDLVPRVAKAFEPKKLEFAEKISQSFASGHKAQHPPVKTPRWSSGRLTQAA